MKVRVSAAWICILLCNFCLGIHRFSTYDSEQEQQTDSATFGITSRHDEFPFMTALGWENQETGETDFLCGGMLIAPDIVLTAAHCLFLKGRLPSIIKIGGNQLNSTYNEDNTIRNVFIHPWYHDTLAYNDVALLKLRKRSRKTPICLWDRPTLTTSSATAIGYGATKYAGSTTPVLQKISLIVVPTVVCRVYHERKRKFRFGISEAHICAGDPNGRQDICQGDSGGPLIVRSNYKDYAIGIIANGQACFGFPPAIYTRISSYIQWISALVREFSSSDLKICD